MIDSNHDPWSTSPYSPRHWQRDAIEAAADWLANSEKKSAIIAAVMGAGKSFVIAELAQMIDKTPNRIVVITTPTIRLVDQLADDVEVFTGQPPGKFYTNEKSIKPVTVCCMPSAVELAKAMEEDGIDCSLWIADEAHKTECDTMKASARALSPDRGIGFTATPFRADSSEALSLWQELLIEYTPADAIRDHVVVPPKPVFWTGKPCTVDTACIKMIEEVKDAGPGMVNATSIDDAEKFSSMLTNAGIPARAVHSKKTPDANDYNLELLRKGELACVVHVNQLAEGANFPWLRWLCMRRPVRSRTRFCQEVGRVLRTHGDKEYGIVLDPHDLFDSHGLSGDYKAVLAGDVEEKPAHQQAAEELEEVLEEIKKSGIDKESAIAMSVEPALAWIKTVKVALRSIGRLDDEISSGPWRKDRATKSQMKSIRFAGHTLSRRVPPHQRTAAKLALRLSQLGQWNKGELSDLLGICFDINKHGWPDEIDSLIQ